MLLPQIEFAYNCSPNRSTSMIPFEIVNGFNPRKPIDLNPCSIHDKTSFSVEQFTILVNYLHDNI